jgi:hypothetical protein
MDCAPLFRVIYVSRNRMPDGAASRPVEIEGILSTARAANARAGITGALLFNCAGFAQVLEGPLPAVGATFERILRDPRHGDVVVLESVPVTERAFPSWSMAFVGEAAGAKAAIDRDPAEAARVLALLRDLVATTAEAIC